MALNGGGRGLGFEVTAKDTATPVLNSFLGTVGKGPSILSGLIRAIGTMGSAASSLGVPIGGAVSGLSSLAAVAGPVAIAVAALAIAFTTFNDVANRSEETLRGSIEAFADYQTGLKEVETIVRGTDEQMAGLGDTALAMSEQFGTTATGQLEGFYQTASAGFVKVADTTALMSTANKLAVAGVSDVESSVTLLALSLNGFQISAQKSMQVSDALFKTVEKGVITIPQLVSSFGSVVPSAAAAGASIEESLAAIAALTLAGQSPAEATIALARAFDLLTKAPPGMMKKMQEYGISADDLSIKQRGLLPVMKTLEEAFKGHEEELVKVVPEIRAFRAIMPLAGKQAEAFAEILDDVRNSTGATDKAFDTMSNRIDFQRQRWAAFTDSLKIKLGAVFAPLIGKVLGILEKLIDTVNAMPAGLQKIVFSFVALALALPVVVKHGGSFLWELGKLAVVGALVMSFLSVMGPTLLLIGAILTPLALEVGALYLAWKVNFFGIRDTVLMVWDKIKLTFQAIGAFIRGGGVISGPLAEELNKTENTGILKFAGAIYSIWTRLKAFGTAVWKGISASIETVKPAIDDLLPTIKPLVEALFGAGDAGTDFEKALPIEKVAAFGAQVGEAIGAVIEAAVKFATWYKSNLHPIFSAAWVGLKAIWTMGKIAFEGLSMAARFWLSGLELALNVLKKIYDTAYDVGQAIAKFVSPYLGTLGFDLAPIAGPLPTGGGIMPPVAPAVVPAQGGGGTQAPKGGPATLPQIVLHLASTMEVDGDKLGEKVQKFVLDLANREMVPAT